MAVLPVMHKLTMGNISLLLRWGLVLLGNLIGTALAFAEMPIFDNATRQAFSAIS